MRAIPTGDIRVSRERRALVGPDDKQTWPLRRDGRQDALVAVSCDVWEPKFESWV